MKALKILGLLLGGLVAVFVVGGLFMPQTATVDRSLEIAAPIAVVFEEVADLERQQGWLPWKAMDPSMETSFGAVTRGVGAWYAWRGDKSGAGKLTVTALEEPTRMDYEMAFEGESGQASGTWTFEPLTDDRTRATWGFVNEADSLFGRWFNAFLPGMLGPQFESGLAALKTIAESRAADLEAEAAALAAAAATAPADGTAPAEFTPPTE